MTEWTGFSDELNGIQCWMDGIQYQHGRDAPCQPGYLRGSMASAPNTRINRPNCRIPNRTVNSAESKTAHRLQQNQCASKCQAVFFTLFL